MNASKMDHNQNLIPRLLMNVEDGKEKQLTLHYIWNQFQSDNQQRLRENINLFWDGGRRHK